MELVFEIHFDVTPCLRPNSSFDFGRSSVEFTHFRRWTIVESFLKKIQRDSMVVGLNF
jgi:hypothetical protein